jgi:hypothetical protein
MIRRRQRFSRVLAMAAAALMAASSAASAQSDSRRASFDLFGAYVQTVDSDFDTEAFGLRGGYRFAGPWAVEASLSRLNEDVDLWFGDFSAKAYFGRYDRVEVYAVAGPGIFRVSDGDFEEDETTVHFGLGAEVALGERAYLRPEVRGRWFADELIFDDGIADYSLGFGWRF